MWKIISGIFIKICKLKPYFKNNMFNQATPQMGGTNFQTGAPAFNAAP